MKDNFGNEQYLWIRFLRKCYNEKLANGYEISEEIIERSEKSYANCCIFLSAQKAGIYNLKIGKSGYGAPAYCSNAGLYTMNDWKKMYNKYCGGRLPIMWNPMENGLYYFCCTMRKMKHSKFKKIYDIIKTAYRGVGR